MIDGRFAKNGGGGSRLPFFRRRRSLLVGAGALSLAGLLALAWPSAAAAQDLEPRVYSNTPVGMSFLILGYVWQSGDVLTDASAPLENASVTVHNTVLAYAHSFDLLGRSAKVDLVVPFAFAEGDALVNDVRQERKVSGLADPRLRVSWNLVGAPSMSLEQYRGWRQDLIIGLSLSVFAPIGRYESDKLLNLGNNRWVFRPEFGLSKALGHFVFEFSAGLSLYTDNNDYFGNNTREQDPVLTLQGHLLYNFPMGIWAAFDTTFYTGGRASINGVAGADQLQNARGRGHAGAPAGPPLLAEAQREHRGLHEHGQRLRYRRRRDPVPLGRRTVTRSTGCGGSRLFGSCNPSAGDSHGWDAKRPLRRGQLTFRGKHGSCTGRWSHSRPLHGGRPMSRFHRLVTALALVSFAALVVAPAPARAESAASLEADASPRSRPCTTPPRGRRNWPRRPRPSSSSPTS